MGKCRDNCEYNRFFVKNARHVLAYKLFHRIKRVDRFMGQKGITLEYSNERLINALKGDKPFCAIRFGAVELSCWNNYRKIELGRKKTYKEKVKYSIKNNAGVFPIDDATLTKYSQESLELLKHVDYLAISGIHMEDYFYMRYAPQSIVIQNWSCEPLLGMWSEALKGKKVLVISPFARDIENQYKKRELLFKGHEEILPSFTLLTIESPLTLGREEIDGSSWFIELEKMKKKMSEIDFDILLVGAGAYGMHLAICAKLLGKKAIQSGGATQTLFGIIGKRWENREHVKKYVDEHWIHPTREIADKENIENGAYW